MDKNEKLAVARKKLKKFQARSSPQPRDNSNNSPAKPTVTQFVTAPLIAPSLAGPLPLNDHSPSLMSLPSTIAPTSSKYSSFNGSSPFLHQSSNSVDLGTLDTVIDLARPLTSSSLHTSPSINYALPNLTGGRGDVGGVRNTSNNPFLNGSILEHLSPSSAPSEPLERKNEAPPILFDEAPPPPYISTKHSRPPEVTLRDLKEGVNHDVPRNEGIQLVGSSGTTHSSGASLGGVLLKHLPYLPSSSNSLRAELGEGSVSDTKHTEEGGEGAAPVGVGKFGIGVSIVDDTDNSELEQKLKMHAQTIDILVSEKSALQLELGSLKTQLTNKSRDCSNWEIQLKTTQHQLADLQKQVNTTSAELSSKNKELSRLKSEHSDIRGSLERSRAMLEEQQEESTELIAKVTAQSAEIIQLRNTNLEIQGKLNMTELLAQQLSGGTPVEAAPTDTTLFNRLQESEDQVKHLKLNQELITRERDQLNSDLTALRDFMLEQQEENARKIRDYQTQLDVSNSKIEDMKKETEDAIVQKEVLERRLSTEHVQYEHSNQVATETLKQERDQLRLQLEQQVQDNDQIIKMNAELESRGLETELKLSRLEEQSVDHQNLLTTMAQDKETLSRAMSQNKELKSNISELEEAFVKLTHQNMELASDLSTERRRLSHLKTQITTPTSSSKSIKTTPVSSQETVGVLVDTSQETAGLLGDPSHSSGNDKAIEKGSQGDIALDPPVQEVEGRSREMDPLISSRGSRDDMKIILEEKQRLIDALVIEKEDLQNQLNQLHSHNTENPQQRKDLPTLVDETPPRIDTVDKALAVGQEPQIEQEHTDGVYSELFSMLPAMADNTHTLSPDKLAEFQTSFNALQQKFVVLMREKADLLEKIEEHELVILKLASEMETVGGDYITLYQTQRDALRDKFQEKDRFIQQLMAEKVAMQANTAQLQVLVRRVLQERSHGSPQPSRKAHTTTTTTTTSTPPSSHPPPQHLQPLQTTPHTSSAESTGIPFHLQPLPSKERIMQDETDYVTLETDSGSIHIPDDDNNDMQNSSSSHVTTATVEQIMELLDQLESSSESTKETLFYCKSCTGNLVML